MKTITVGEHKLGGETVLFRHEKTLVNKNLFAVSLCTCMDEATVDAKLADMVKLCAEIDAFLCYAYLGDVGDSVTGDKKAQKFEDDYLDELFGVLRDCGFSAVTYMPSRNTKEQLRRVMDLCHANGLFEISGEDINSPRQIFIIKAMENPMFQNLIDATWKLIEHENTH